MSISTGREARALAAVRAVILAALVPAMGTAGCATTTAYNQPSWVAGGPPPAPRVDAETVIAKAKEQTPATEEDGLPSQLPPRTAARALPDDPSQPWSPNYGGPATKKTAISAPSPAASQAQDQSAMTALQQLATRSPALHDGNY